MDSEDASIEIFSQPKLQGCKTLLKVSVCSFIFGEYFVVLYFHELAFVIKCFLLHALWFMELTQLRVFYIQFLWWLNKNSYSRSLYGSHHGQVLWFGLYLRSYAYYTEQLCIHATHSMNVCSNLPTWKSQLVRETDRGLNDIGLLLIQKLNGNQNWIDTNLRLTLHADVKRIILQQITHWDDRF